MPDVFKCVQWKPDCTARPGSVVNQALFVRHLCVLEGVKLVFCISDVSLMNVLSLLVLVYLQNVFYLCFIISLSKHAFLFNINLVL